MSSVRIRTARPFAYLRVAAWIVATSLTAAPVQPDWIELFDGRTLSGWVVRGGHASYRPEDGAIVGTTGGAGGWNTFLCTTREYADFELEFEVMVDPRLNSGVQIRSRVYEQDTPQASNPQRLRQRGEVYGYQCEIADNGRCTSGNVWDEARRTRWLDDISARPGACAAFRSGRWNHYRIVAEGPRIRTWVNGVPCADITDTTDASGLIGLQVHAIASDDRLEVRFRHLRLRELRGGGTQP